jgi:hypothetical protein
VTDYSDELLASIQQRHQAGQIGDYDAALLRGYADACQRLNTVLPSPDYQVDLLGYGTVPPLLVSHADHDIWVYVGDLIDPAGVTSQQAHDHWEHEDREGDDADEIRFHATTGETWSLRILNFQGVLRLFLEHSPWSQEVMTALMPVFRRAMAHSGLAERITLHGDSDGQPKTLGDLIREQPPLASYEVARHQAFTGPAAALDRGDAEQ